MYIVEKQEETLSQANYIEINLFHKRTNHFDEFEVYDNTVDRQHFNNLMKKMKNVRHGAFFQKDRVEYTYLNMVMNYDPKEMNYSVFSHNQKRHEFFEKERLLVNYYKKASEPIYKFPSTNNIMRKRDISTLTVKITNRLYINFEIIKAENEEDYEYRVYMNYNHHKDVDLTHMEKEIKNVLYKLF